MHIRRGPAPDLRPGAHAAGHGGKGGHESSGRQSLSPLSGGASGAWVPAPTAAEEHGQMTRQKTFKRRVRERMAKTGESYTAARRMLIAKGDRPDTTTAPFEPPVAEERVAAATGRGGRAPGRIRRERVEDHRRPRRAAVRGVRGRGAARALAPRSGAPRTHGHAPANRPLRLGGRLDPGHRRI